MRQKPLSKFFIGSDPCTGTNSLPLFFQGNWDLRNLWDQQPLPIQYVCVCMSISVFLSLCIYLSLSLSISVSLLVSASPCLLFNKPDEIHWVGQGFEKQINDLMARLNQHAVGIFLWVKNHMRIYVLCPMCHPLLPWSLLLPIYRCLCQPTRWQSGESALAIFRQKYTQKPFG